MNRKIKPMLVKRTIKKGAFPPKQGAIKAKTQEKALVLSTERALTHTGQSLVRVRRKGNGWAAAKTIFGAKKRKRGIRVVLGALQEQITENRRESVH